MGGPHPSRPFVSRRDFLRRAGVAGGAAAGGPWFWRQLAYAADAPVTQVHTTFGRDASRELTVSWMTPEPVRDPFVQVGDWMVAAETAQYAGYPGYLHHARLKDLRRSTTYGYRVGHAGQPASEPEAFVTGPGGRSPFRFTAFGDQGVDVGAGVPPASQPPNQASANTELARSMNPAFHLIVGDLAYANGDQSIWDAWFRMIEPMARTTPWMPCIGNHEIESQLDFLGTEDSWGTWGYDPYRTRFALPDNGHPDLANCFYAFRYGSVQFLMLDNNDINEEIAPNRDYTGGRQREWVEHQLRKASRDPRLDFIVVGMHQCAFSSSTKHGSDPGVQDAWLDLFATYGVDLVLQGHDHVYERSHGLRGTSVSADATPYRSDRGTVFITCGNGGAIQEVFQPTQPEWSAFRQHLKVGTLRVEVEPAAAGGMSRMVLSEHWALDGSPIEEGIVLERPARRSRRREAAMAVA